MCDKTAKTKYRVLVICVYTHTLIQPRNLGGKKVKVFKLRSCDPKGDILA